MWLFTSELRWLSSHHGTPGATRHCRAAAAARAALLAVQVACIDPGPLFSEDLAGDAGAAALGEGSAGGEPATRGPDNGGELRADAGLVSPDDEPAQEGLGRPPACDDGGLGAGCAPELTGEDMTGEPAPGEPVPGEPAPGEPTPGEANACDACLSEACPAVLERCDGTPGCGAIVACARRSGCQQDECYCGNINLLLCTTTGQANGPCRDVMLSVPGGRPPSFIEPNAGPASLAASEVGECRIASAQCRSVCGG